MSETSTSVHELQQAIATWADQINPNRTALSTIAKLLEEIGELIASERMNDPNELADVAILVLDLFHLQGVDICSAIKGKMIINITRKWRIADNGAMSHVPD